MYFLLNFKIILDIFCKAIDLGYRMNAYIILVLGHSCRKKQTKEKKNLKFFFFKLGLP